MAVESGKNPLSVVIPVYNSDAILPEFFGRRIARVDGFYYEFCFLREGCDAPHETWVASPCADDADCVLIARRGVGIVKLWCHQYLSAGRGM